VAALAGTTDVDAITLSMAQYARAGHAATAAHAITVAAIANTVVKAAMVTTIADPSLRKPVLAASAALISAGVGSILLVH
jgi:uncharacterized membrane protein (DUF4010 family)